MDETMNNFTWDVSGTTSASDTMTFTTDDTWFPYWKESTWLPYDEEKYEPKWHISQGYRNQIKNMWN